MTNATSHPTIIGTFSAERVRSIAAEVARRASPEARKDYVAPRSKLDVVPLEGGPTATSSGFGLILKNGSEHLLPIKRSALSQLANSAGVPLRYLDRLTGAGHYDLAAANIAELLSLEGTTTKGDARKHLVRTLDGSVDAFLSNSYRAISNDDILTIALAEFKAAGVTLWDLKVTDTEFRVSAVSPHITGKVTTDRAFKGPKRWEGKEGDVLNAAVTLKNSETGHSALAAQQSIWRFVCQNFNVWADVIATRHLGGKLAEGEHFFSQQTRDLQAQALVSSIRDAIRTTFDPVAFQKQVDEINATTRRELGDSPITVVDAAIKVTGLPTGYRDAILAELLGTGDVTQYGLVQAVTSRVNPENTKDKEVDDIVRCAFEDAGGKLLRLNDKGWKSFLTEAYKPTETSADEVVTASA